MTQRIFDIENEQDVVDLWDLIPDEINDIHKDLYGMPVYFIKTPSTPSEISAPLGLIKINWHDKTEIHRPFKEATEAEVGKLCKFWDKVDYTVIGILSGIATNGSWRRFVMESKEDGYYKYCRPLKYEEIKELCKNE